jgi:hypothetical protein
VSCNSARKLVRQRHALGWIGLPWVGTKAFRRQCLCSHTVTTRADVLFTFLRLRGPQLRRVQTTPDFLLGRLHHAFPRRR